MPLHRSGKSHADTAARHTNDVDLNWQLLASQQGGNAPRTVSHVSPASNTPLPHMRGGAVGAASVVAAIVVGGAV